MIDITGLREDKRPQSSTIVHALLDRLEAAESECLEQARLNGMGSEREAALMAKLEAAEKSDAESLAMYRKARDERDALRAKIEAAEKERANANAAAAGIALKAQKLEDDRAIDTQRMAILVAKMNEAERERDALRAENASLVDDMNLLRDNNTALRGRIEEMEKQESVATVIKEGDSRYWMSERLWTFPDGKYPLYALPGAQTAPSVPDGWLRAIDEALVTARIGVANAHDTYEQAKAKLDNLIGFFVDVATDPAVNGGWKLMPAVSTYEMDIAGASHCDGYLSMAAAVWDAMFAAAPEVKL
jgi:chromosome segregation ATPase